MSAMDVHTVMEHGLGVLRTLLQVTWQGALWALVVWAITRLLPKLPASVRTTLWWLVGLKCLVGLCMPGAVRLPLLPASEVPVAIVKTEAPAVALEGTRPMASNKGGTPTPEVHAPEARETRRDWRPLLLGALLLWLGGIAWQGRELLRGLVQLRRIRREARPLEESTLQQAAEVLGRELGLTRIPRLLVSEHAPSPLAMGLLRPEVIFPRRALETLSPLEQRMALAHELAHVRRGDLWLGWVPALAQVAFFFHPLVRRACREYALAREEACDAAALQATGAAPREYGRLLLVFGVARAPAAAAMPGASSHLAALKRRIAMLEHASTDSKQRRQWIRWTLGGLAVVALVPFQVVARETPATATAAPPVALAPAAVTPPAVPVKPSEPALAIPAKAPAALPRLALAAPPAAPPKPPAAPSTQVIDVQGDEDEDLFSYVLLRSSDSASMSGSMRDLRRARALAAGGNQPLLYMRQDEQEYLIRDAATLKTFESLFAPMEEIGKKQQELGKKQEEIGRKMSELGNKQSGVGDKQSEVGERMGALGKKQGELGEKMGEIGLKLAEVSLAQRRYEREHDKESPELERQEEQLEREQDALEKQMDELGRQMDALGDEMDKHNEPMEEFGRQMDALGKEMEKYSEPMEELGEQMEKANREAQQKARALLDDAVRKGVAEPVKR
ncbi:M56 family metallopeptidase [Archangium lansingense]|uniref:Biotin transporter BioY n=1 Tax=Archangium lansingense TaxID=2995310 RepID=A0ABT3ZYX5_9BACT|nr:M56 family metallopeptidase [Archangium lansinium]MCY1073867.1 biotin transporter BioY [Archangium lansinium]